MDDATLLIISMVILYLAIQDKQRKQRTKDECDNKTHMVDDQAKMYDLWK